MKYALAVEYDGRAFHGWQIQKDLPTVQAALEAALGQMAGEAIQVHAAGRTDAGVHGARQIVHFETTVNRPLTAWVRGINSFLPDAVAVLWAKPVSEVFHARFSAFSRHYRYLLLSHPVRPALWSGRMGWTFYELDFEAMQAAARHLLGQHDFTSFRAAECQAKSPVKTMTQVQLQKEGNLFICDFSADAFLHHMVRNIMGALLHVGKGHESPEWMADLILARDRTSAPPTFMPDGLYLAGVSYPPEFALDSEPVLRHGLI
ncbi:tRNA pseudouridine(38-40) synthase TruA [Iodobacter ciconiae]|uniref:tRNA pseudouridine synthase A n=1 Tax=Iodobacter ciconiae TaxID=2496266 RepID=A0A3S8ZRW3_9NEIS|nr:tRNA pseudouridine(38-40) synthase TruA [Iodobacter ciconiae]AZN36243.1 tRNA pseudouridine(38-40) synthase TruA [Iodobacter ciconiae]